MASSYSSTSEAYLQRARQCLSYNTDEALIYAALELRCGIECRMREYLEAQSHVSKQVKEGWKIAKLGKGMEQAFGTTEQVIQLNICNESGKSLGVFYYTPVTKRLQQAAQRLGDIVHPPRKQEERDLGWWQSLRHDLENVYDQLHHANLGNCLGPPLMHKNKKSGKVTIVLRGVVAETFPDTELAETRTQIIKVEYLDAHPNFNAPPR